VFRGSIERVGACFLVISWEGIRRDSD
jgi:hypothetical protein